MDTEHDFSLGFHGGIDVTKAQRNEASLIKKHWIRQGKHGKGVEKKAEIWKLS